MIGLGGIALRAGVHFARWIRWQTATPRKRITGTFIAGTGGLSTPRRALASLTLSTDDAAPAEIEGGGAVITYRGAIASNREGARRRLSLARWEYGRASDANKRDPENAELMAAYWRSRIEREQAMAVAQEWGVW